jgi:ATP-dependent protease HslVU (ClpYQ) peptidase subunit
MTVGIVIRVPGHGAVIGSDSRVTSGHDKVTDDCVKHIICGSVVVTVAGQDGALFELLRSAKTWRSVMERGATYNTLKPSQEWALLGYDRKTNRCLSFDSDLCQLDVGNLYAHGSGASYAMGAAAVCPRPRDLAAARRTVRRACAAAVRFNLGCGGKIRTVTIPTDPKLPIEVS